MEEKKAFQKPDEEVRIFDDPEAYKSYLNSQLEKINNTLLTDPATAEKLYSNLSRVIDGHTSSTPTDILGRFFALGKKIQPENTLPWPLHNSPTEVTKDHKLSISLSDSKTDIPTTSNKNDDISLHPLLGSDHSDTEEDSSSTSCCDLPFKKIFGCVAVMTLVSGAATGAYYAYKNKEVLHQGFFFDHDHGQAAGMLWTILILASIALAVGIHPWVNSDNKEEAAGVRETNMSRPN